MEIQISPNFTYWGSKSTHYLYIFSSKLSVYFITKHRQAEETTLIIKLPTSNNKFFALCLIHANFEVRINISIDIATTGTSNGTLHS